MVLCYKFVAKARVKDGKPRDSFARLPSGCRVFTPHETFTRREKRVNETLKAKAQNSLKQQPRDSVWRDMLDHDLCKDIFRAFFSGSLMFALPLFGKLRQVEAHSTLAKFKQCYGDHPGWDDNGTVLRHKFIAKVSPSTGIPSRLFMKLTGSAANKPFVKGTPHPPVCAWLRCSYRLVCRALCTETRYA
jgi:hypothetical protein